MNHIEAMKQALEALLDSIDDVRDCLNQNLPHAGYARYDRRIEAYRERIAKHEKAIADLTTAIEQAETAQGQEPVAWLYQYKPAGTRFVTLEMASAINHQQVRETPLYTSPPAAPASQEEIQRLSALVRAQQITIEKLESQRQWVGLSTDEIYDMYSEPRSDAEMVEFALSIEAKLREKNGGAA